MVRIFYFLIFSSLLFGCKGENSASPAPEISNLKYSPASVYPLRPKDREYVYVSVMVKDAEDDAQYVLLEINNEEYRFDVEIWSEDRTNIEFWFEIFLLDTEGKHPFKVSAVDSLGNVSNKLSGEIINGNYLEDITGTYQSNSSGFTISSIDYADDDDCSSLELGYYEFDTLSFIPDTCIVVFFEAISPSGRRIKMTRQPYPLEPCEGSPSVNLIEPANSWKLEDLSYGEFYISFESSEEFLIEHGGSICVTQ